MKDLVSKIFTSPLFRVGCRECSTMKYATELYEIYFEVCDFDRPSIKQFVVTD